MADKPDRTRLLARWSQLTTERSSWITHWKDISDNLLPRSGRFFIQDRDLGNKRNNNIYDSTGTRALRVLAAGMMSGLTSPARPWFRLATVDTDLMKYEPVKVWLNDVTNLMLMIYQRSNTYRMLHSMYEELGAFGTSCAILAPDFRNVIHSYPLTVGEYCIATNWKGEVTTLYREFQKTVHEMIAEFGYANCSPTVQNMYDRGNLDPWVTIMHCIEPRSDRDPSKSDSLNMAWRSIYFELSGNPDKFLRESGYRKFPALCPRWSTSGGDIYGNSPGMEALGDIRQLQQEQLRKAQGIDYKTKPPLQVPTSLKNRETDLLPGGLTYVDSPSPQSAIRTAYEVNLDLSHLLADIQDVRQRINSTFYADLFLMISEMNDPRMTATEVAARNEEKMLMLGPVLERLQKEMLDPLIDFTFDQVMETGIAPPPPQELQGNEISVELVSMLAQAQQAIGTNSIDRFIGAVGQVAQFKPEVLDKVNADKWIDIYGDSLGIDPSILVPDDQVQAIRQQRAQQQAAAAQSAMLNQGADTAQKLASANTSEPNALTDVTRAFSGYS